MQGTSVHPRNIDVDWCTLCLCESVTEQWQENLENLFDKLLLLFILYLSAFNSFVPVAVSDVDLSVQGASLLVILLSRDLPCVHSVYKPRTRAKAGIKAAPCFSISSIQTGYEGVCSGVAMACRGWSWLITAFLPWWTRSLVLFFPVYVTASWFEHAHWSCIVSLLPKWVFLGPSYKCNF